MRPVLALWPGGPLTNPAANGNIRVGLPSIASGQAHVQVYWVEVLQI